MQAEAPEAVDLASETDETRSLYGLDDKATESYGRLCLLARRLVERGVRFVQLYCGAGAQWDAHQDIEGNHAKNCLAMDKPVAGLLKDLKRRGLLDQTLVVWGGEFGRTPMSEKGDGRDHNPYGFTMWMAGGGVKAGIDGRPDRRGRPARHRRPAPRPRHPRHDPPLPGRRPLQADLSPPGPPRTAHRQRGAGMSESCWLESTMNSVGPRFQFSLRTLLLLTAAIALLLVPVAWTTRERMQMMRAQEAVLQAREVALRSVVREGQRLPRRSQTLEQLRRENEDLKQRVEQLRRKVEPTQEHRDAY